MRGVGAVVSERASAAMLGDVTVRTVRPGLLAVTAKATRDAGSVLRGVARPGRLTIRAITRTARAGDDPSSPSSHSPPSCAELGGRAATSDDPSRELIACDATGAAPYVLAPAAVMAAGMSSVTWSQDGGFVVEFTDAGQRAFTALTRSALNKQVAVVLDGAILAAPTVEAVINGSASFRTSLDDVHTRVLRGLLAAGPLEATVTVGRITTV
jgi:preprotein translocase subunit SecD